MDIGWPRSLFWIANGFTGLGLKDTAVDTVIGKIMPSVGKCQLQEDSLPDVLGSPVVSNPSMQGIFSHKQMPSATGWGLL